MPRGSTLVLAVLAAAIAFATSSASQASSEAAIYSAVFNGDCWGLESLSQLVVKSNLVPMPKLAGSSPEWLKEWTEVPAALRRAVDETPTLSQLTLRPELFPAGTRFAANRAVESIFVPREGAPEANWELFRREFRAAGWVAFSDIYFAAEKTDALLYYEGRCGSLYGIGAYVWLHRESADAAWGVRKRIVSWMS